ncbi:tRNA pseudouridine(55) synthase TruB [Candidatus Uhrbacteria bacterium]|jgi:tRNA pseudouridine55 synthase|nr:tRNA pseudouridine(55) synthase TruB [Candidatus Uhrbacteria bacterium]
MTKQETETTLKQAESQGFLLIDKPAGITSHDVVDRVRRATGIRRVGHAGTLDPFATGLLIIGVGRPATREMQKLVGLDKKYEAVFVLGAKSDTDDREGVIVKSPIEKGSDAVNALKQFEGKIEQIPPTYSAIKIDGKKMYESARAGRPLIASARQITIYSITGKMIDEQRLSVSIHSSTGTYIRAIARDLGESLGGGGYADKLRRTTIGPFNIKDAIPAKGLTLELVQTHLIPVEGFLAKL